MQLELWYVLIEVRARHAAHKTALTVCNVTLFHNNNILYYNHSSNATVVTVALNGNKINTLQSLVTLANNCASDNTNQDLIIQFTRLRYSM
jgi:hypothetical protein